MAGMEEADLEIHFKDQKAGLSRVGNHLWEITKSQGLSRTRLRR